MKKTNHLCKLTLPRQIIRTLGADELRAVDGGLVFTSFCTNTTVTVAGTNNSCGTGTCRQN